METRLKGYSATSVFLGQPGICHFTSLNFHIIPDWFPWGLPSGKTTPRSHFRTIFENFTFSLVSRAVLTEKTRQGVNITYCFVCMWVCVFPSIVEASNARDHASDVVLRKLLCVKYLCRHVIDNHSRDLQASNCARVSVKPGRATRSKRQLLNFLKTNSKSVKHSYLPPH